jgi:EAL domain-containing protein (putative c-di-GMP-specific phosphodiesterase class I)
VIDLEAMRLALDALERSPALPGLAINLSASSLHTATFRDGFSRLVRLHPACASRLWVEVAERGAFSRFEAFADFVRRARGAGCRVGIEHFGFRAGDIGRLHELALDYLKVDSAYVAGLHEHPGNRHFLRGLCGIAHGIGIEVFAEGVTDGETAAILRAEGFDGITGPAVAAPDHAAGSPAEKR